MNLEDMKLSFVIECYMKNKLNKDMTALELDINVRTLRKYIKRYEDDNGKIIPAPKRAPINDFFIFATNDERLNEKSWPNRVDNRRYRNGFKRSDTEGKQEDSNN